MDMVLDTAVKYNDIFLSGVKITIIISLLSCFFGLLLGIILAFMKISGIKVLQLDLDGLCRSHPRYAGASTDFPRILRAAVPRHPFPQLPDHGRRL